MITNLSSINDLKVRILSIDPGTKRLGVCVSECNITKFTPIFVDTINTEKVINKSNEYYVEAVGKNIAMYNVITDCITHLVDTFQPDIIYCESAYMGSFAHAFAQLTLCTQAIRQGVINFSSLLPFEFIDPSSIKKNIGVSGRSGDKDMMTTAVLNCSDINKVNIDISQLDEHSIDSIAIGYYGYVTIFRG